MNFIAEAAGVLPEDILDYELCLYNPEKPMLLGIHDELISAPRLDDITSACAAVYGLIDSAPKDKVAMAVLFDHEEIESRARIRQCLTVFLKKYGHPSEKAAPNIFQTFMAA